MARKPNDFKKMECVEGRARCVDMNTWGKAWHDWATDLLTEIDELRLAVCNLEKQVYYGVVTNKGSICDARGPIPGGTGGGPTDTSQPPKPPFRP